MDDFKQKLRDAGFKGEIDASAEKREAFSHDASMFEMMPKLIVSPHNTQDVACLVRTTAGLKTNMSELSLTARSAGTDMSGGAINDSVIVDFSKYFTIIEHISSTGARVQPGVFYRDFDIATRKKGALLPPYPASRDLCTVGGMVNNNAGGEKSLEFGKTENFVEELEFVFADGVARTVKPLNKNELDKKMRQKDFEGKVYRDIFKLVDAHYDQIKAAKPHVTKNSTGYNLWDVWDREADIFDLTKLIVGAQGTLGFVTDIRFRLTKARPDGGLLVLFLRDIDNLGELIETVVNAHPARFESFDDQTLLLTLRFMPSFLKMLGWKKFIHLLITLIPDGLQLLRGFPKLVLMISFKGNSEEEVREQIKALHRQLAQHKARYEINGFEEAPTEGKAEKFWIMRRQSFNLLRSKVKDKHTAPFIDDFVVPPPRLTEFLPKLRAIIKKYKLFATIAGHMGDGNFHVIPLMKLEDPSERAKLLPAMKEVNNLVLKYGGSLSGEHNDGLIRGPWLKKMYGKETLELFKEAKHIFDPQDIFNPHKKTDATWEFSFSHIRDHF